MINNKEITIDDFGQSLSEVGSVEAQLPKVVEDPEKPKRGRPKSKPIKEGPSVRNKNPLNSDMSYLETYKGPAQMIAGTISQIDDLGNKITEDLNHVRSSRTLKNKYLYISNLSGALTSIMSSKISAIKELRGMVTDSNNFELKKQNQLKIDERDSDDKIIMDMYNAYLNAPVGSLGQSPKNISPVSASYINSNPTGTSIVTGDTGSYAASSDPGYDAYINNLSPEQKAMVNEKNPYIETVLVYNQTDQSKWFEVIDTRTGMPVEGIPVPPDFVRDGCNVNIRAGIARNAALNQTYKLKLVGLGQTDEF